jgi:hypothetical protein
MGYGGGPPPAYSPGYGGPPSPSGTPGIVIAGFILAFILPLIGLILCAVGMGDAKRRNAGEGLAIAGMVISVVCMFLYLAAILGA